LETIENKIKAIISMRKSNSINDVEFIQMIHLIFNDDAIDDNVITRIIENEIYTYLKIGQKKEALELFNIYPFKSHLSLSIHQTFADSNKSITNSSFQNNTTSVGLTSGEIPNHEKVHKRISKIITACIFILIVILLLQYKVNIYPDR
jgi:hypothetical protein